MFLTPLDPETFRANPVRRSLRLVCRRIICVLPAGEILLSLLASAEKVALRHGSPTARPRHMQACALGWTLSLRKDNGECAVKGISGGRGVVRLHLKALDKSRLRIMAREVNSS